MSLNPRNTRSIASRLVFSFTLAGAFLVASSLGAFYWLVVRHSFEEDNAALNDKIAGLVQAVKQSGTTRALQSELQSTRAGEHSPYRVRVMDSNGQVLAETPDMGRSLPPNTFPAPQAVSFDESRTINYRVGGRLFSLVATIVPTNRERYVLQVAQDRSADENFNRQTGLLFLATVAASVFASAIIARSAIGRGLQPVAEITRSVQSIGPTRLSDRVASTEWPRELQPLAEAFDQMLNRLEDSFTRLSQFSADLAHELRTPIANILGEAQVALTRERTTEEYRGVIESTVAECERLSHIVDNLLFLARAESAREHIKRTHFDGRAAIEKVASFYRTIADDRNVKIECEGHGTVHADSVLFTRAINNLLDNAIRFTPEGGSVGVAISSRDIALEISVTDTGCGIASEHLARVFDRFYRVDPSRSSVGAGLGLALVKSIAEMHGGSATVDSQINRGTTVTLRFPNSPVAVSTALPE
jgi:two-component system, OmpR family, heavy metal sensor histidine kinase CusS